MSYFSHSWLPYIYQYGLGGLLFATGMYLTIKAGSFKPSHPNHRKWFSILLFGFVWYATMHASWTLAALGHELIALVGGGTVVAVALGITIWHIRRGA